MSIELNGSTGIDFNDGSNQSTAATPYARKNLIINGDMRIDQRNAGASFTPTNNSYGLDRWKHYASQASKYTAQQSTTAPTYFNNSLVATSSSAYTVGASEYFLLAQAIEGLNTAHLKWGTSDAKTVTLSFWVRSSLTGTFGGAIGNSAGSRSYPFEYTISSADTWEQKSITIAGDTTGTWLETNSVGIIIYWSLGSGATVSGTSGAWSAGTYTSATGATSVVGTSGATLYITGCQLEVNDSASDFEFVPYDMELARCQRYYQKYTANFDEPLCNATYYTSTAVYGVLDFNTTMRAKPTGSVSGTGAFRLLGQGGAKTSTATGIGQRTVNSGELTGTFSAGTAGYSGWIRGSSAMYVDFSAEL